MLRPLSAPAVEADVVHASMNGLSMLVGMVAKWTHGTPLLLSEHGIYLRERYISYLDEDTPHPVKVLILNFFRSLAGAAYLACDALAPHSGYNRRWQLPQRRRAGSHVDDVQRRGAGGLPARAERSRPSRRSCSPAGSTRSRTCTR